MPPNRPPSSLVYAEGPAGGDVRRRNGRRRMPAREQIAALGEMSAGFAHDFRNILAVIASALSLAERNRRNPGKFEAALHAARDGIERGANLAAKIIAFARPGKTETEPKDVNDVLLRLKPLLEFAAGPRTALIYELGEGLPRCNVDASRLGAALLNLVANARDAIPDGGTIRIVSSLVRMMESSDEADTRAVLVRVIDDGPGMDAAIREHIFDPWFTTKSGAGTGLGLPQVAAFMRASGGCINVSTEPGAGTSVDLYFPVSEGGGLIGSALWSQLDGRSGRRISPLAEPAGQ